MELFLIIKFAAFTWIGALKVAASMAVQCVNVCVEISKSNPSHWLYKSLAMYHFT